MFKLRLHFRLRDKKRFLKKKLKVLVNGTIYGKECVLSGVSNRSYHIDKKLCYNEEVKHMTHWEYESH